MLTTRLLHPGILEALASNGHGSKVLVADGNYPFTSGAQPRARKVFLNLARDLLPVTDVLRVLADAVPIESALVMLPEDGSVPAIHAEFAVMLGAAIPMETCRRLDFYRAARSEDTCLVIATGESRRFANVLLTLGVVR